MKKNGWKCGIVLLLCCVLLAGCLQIKERGTGGSLPSDKTADSQIRTSETTAADTTDTDFLRYARMEAELSEQAKQIAAVETRLAELEASQTARSAPPETEPETQGNPPEATEAKQEAESEAEETSPYRYSLTEDGYAVITSYLGAEETVVIPSELDGHSVVAIGEDAFRNAGAVAVVIPDGVKRIDWFAFSGCHRLSSVTVPDTVTEIGYGAFELCSPTLSFICSETSYSATYAKSYGISLRNPE